MQFVVKLSLILSSLSIISCTTTPTKYGDTVEVINGPYNGERGYLIEDCSGFERYKIRLFFKNIYICEKIWNLKKMW